MMPFNVFKNTVLLFVLVMISCGNFSKSKAINKDLIKDSLLTEDQIPKTKNEIPKIVVGANQTSAYLPFLKGKRVGIMANQSSVIFKDRNYVHLVDSLLSLKINVVNVFAPEHGFRGTADAGELVKDGIDTKTGVPIISLYGDNKKPKPARFMSYECATRTPPHYDRQEPHHGYFF